MRKYEYAKGRILESIQFISGEIAEFEKEYSKATWKEYQNDIKLQKLIDRTVENILTAFIEIAGAVLTEEGIGSDSYANSLLKLGKYLKYDDTKCDSLAKLAIQRNRLAHRYLNFKWEAIKTFNETKDLIKNSLKIILEREEKR